MEKTKNIIKGIENYLERHEIEIDTQINLKLNLLEDLINNYKMCVSDIAEKGITIMFNHNQTIGINPTFKAKTEIIKLIIKLLKELGIERKRIEDDEEETTQDYIERLCS